MSNLEDKARDMVYDAMIHDDDYEAQAIHHAKNVNARAGLGTSIALMIFWLVWLVWPEMIDDLFEYAGALFFLGVIGLSYYKMAVALKREGRTPPTDGARQRPPAGRDHDDSKDLVTDYEESTLGRRRE